MKHITFALIMIAMATALSGCVAPCTECNWNHDTHNVLTAIMSDS